MTVHTLQSKAPALDLPAGFYLQLEAVDADTGSAVTGVTVSRIAVYGEELDSLDVNLETSGPFVLVPGPNAGGGETFV